MATLINAVHFEKEERLQIPVTGADIHCIVVSGYTFFDGGELTGSPDSDYKYVDYEVHIPVGPEWQAIRDVSPIVTPAGFSHFSSDEADATGYEVKTCTWIEIPGQTANTKRIELKVGFKSRGGTDAEVTRLAYHLVANGRLAPGAGI